MVFCFKLLTLNALSDILNAAVILNKLIRGRNDDCLLSIVLKFDLFEGNILVLSETSQFY